jgi:threonine/homoserine/homoserine lactone efflux protein
MFAFATMGFIAISLWAGLGVAIRQWLTSVQRKRYFNWFMGVMTAATLILILAD